MKAAPIAVVNKALWGMERKSAQPLILKARRYSTRATPSSQSRKTVTLCSLAFSLVETM